MALYFFHLRDGVDILLDPEGRTLDGQAAIAAAALSEARALFSADVLTGRVDLDQRIEVEDDKGVVVHGLRLGDAVDFIPHDPAGTA